MPRERTNPLPRFSLDKIVNRHFPDSVGGWVRNADLRLWLHYLSKLPSEEVLPEIMQAAQHAARITPKSESPPEDDPLYPH